MLARFHCISNRMQSLSDSRGQWSKVIMTFDSHLSYDDHFPLGFARLAQGKLIALNTNLTAIIYILFLSFFCEPYYTVVQTYEWIIQRIIFSILLQNFKFIVSFHPLEFYYICGIFSILCGKSHYLSLYYQSQKFYLASLIYSKIAFEKDI